MREVGKGGGVLPGIAQEVPGDPERVLYNLACRQSRLKQPEEAVEDLTKAVENGWADADHMRRMKIPI